MVCTGNICRSPMAEAILRAAVDDSRLRGRVVVDSAGTHGYHVGEQADRRARAALTEAGYDPAHRARLVRPQWLAERDLVLAMDRGHLRLLDHLAAGAGLSAANQRMLRDFDPDGPGDVPDPYYDTIVEFREVRTMIQRCTPALLDELQRLAGAG